MKSVIATIAALSLAGCSTLKADTAPGCHGARRPANPHGSVLAQAGEAASSTVAPAAPGCGRPRP